jgi:hypothetical protein
MGYKKLVLVTDKGGCITPSSHKLNRDGYFRKNIGKKSWFYHRYVWTQENGDIPEGFEINHKCKTRACCNLDHLECLDGSEHASLSNSERYADRHQSAFKYWSEEKCTGVHLGKEFGVSFSAACRWIREWKV